MDSAPRRKTAQVVSWLGGTKAAVAVIAALLVLGGTVTAGWRYSTELDARASALDARRQALSDRSQNLDARSNALDARQTELDRRDQAAAATAAALDARKRDLDSQQASLESSRLQFQQDLATYTQQSCTVWVAGHDANTTFLGTGDGAACSELESWLRSYRIATLQGSESSAGILCRGSVGSLIYRVRDTGSMYYGSYLCDALARWSQGTPLSAITTSFRR